MSTPAAAPAGWSPDPFGRFQWRYWDGAKWTEQVATQGEQATDPPTGEVAMADRAVFEAPQVGYWYQGHGNPEGFPVYAGDTPVAAVRVTRRWTSADDYFLEDTAARPLLMVHPTADRRDAGYEVLDPQRGFIGLVNGVQLELGHSRYDVLDGQRQPRARVLLDTSRTSIENCVVAEWSGGQVARVEQGRERTGFLSGLSWLTLEREPALEEPLRTLLVAVPLALHSDLTQRSVMYNTYTRSDIARSRWDPL